MSKQQFEEEYWSHHTQKLEERHKLALDLIGETGSLLDLGCGDGLFLKHARARKKVGLEMSETAVKRAQKNKIDVRLSDFEHERLPFEDNEFDVVALLDVLEHTFQPHVQLKNASRVGKKIVITVPNFAYVAFRLQALLGLIPTILNERKGHCFYFTHKKVHEIFQRAGLRIVKETYYFPLMHVPIIGFISRIFGSFLPGLFATEFAVLGEKE